MSPGLLIAGVTRNSCGGGSGGRNSNSDADSISGNNAFSEDTSEPLDEGGSKSDLSQQPGQPDERGSAMAPVMSIVSRQVMDLAHTAASDVAAGNPAHSNLMQRVIHVRYLSGCCCSYSVAVLCRTAASFCWTRWWPAQGTRSQRSWECVRAFIAPETPHAIDVCLVGENPCLLYTSPSPRDKRQSRMPSSA